MEVDKSTIPAVLERIKKEKARKFKKVNKKMKKSSSRTMSKGMKSLIAQAKAHQIQKQDD